VDGNPRRPLAEADAGGQFMVGDPGRVCGQAGFEPFELRGVPLVAAGRVQIPQHLAQKRERPLAIEQPVGAPIIRRLEIQIGADTPVREDVRASTAFG